MQTFEKYSISLRSIALCCSQMNCSRGNADQKTVVRQNCRIFNGNGASFVLFNAICTLIKSNSFKYTAVKFVCQVQLINSINLIDWLNDYLDNQLINWLSKQSID